MVSPERVFKIIAGKPIGLHVGRMDSLNGIDNSPAVNSRQLVPVETEEEMKA